MTFKILSDNEVRMLAEQQARLELGQLLDEKAKVAKHHTAIVERIESLRSSFPGMQPHRSRKLTKKWSKVSAHEKIQMLKLKEQGLSNAAIGREVGRSHTCVRKWLESLNTKSPSLYGPLSNN